MKISAVALTQRILFAALFCSLVIYGVVVVAATHGRPAPAHPPSTSILIALGGLVAALQVIVIPLMRTKTMPARERVGDGRTWDFEAEVPAAAAPAIAQLRTGLIVTWALCEACAACGVVAAMVFNEPTYYAPFGVVGAASMLAYAPTRGLFESVLRAAEK